MNICCFSRVNYWHGIYGGMDLHGRLLAEGIVERGHTVTMISTRHPSSDKTGEEHGGVHVFYLPGTVFGSRRKGWAATSVVKFLELHRQRPFDLVWSQSFDAFGLAGEICSIPRLPVIATLHGSIQQEYTTFLANIGSGLLHPLKTVFRLAGLYYSYFMVQKPLLAIADRIITVSRQVAKDLGRWYGPGFAARCETVANGVDTALFRPDEEQRREMRQATGCADEDIVLLTMGRLTHEKGHHLAIRALKPLLERNIPARLAVVGDGPERGFLEKLAQQQGVREKVIFFGRVDNSRMIRYYNGADIVLMPTLTVEGLPFVLLEALACGRPVIASRIGGTAEAINDRENGLLVAPGDLPATVEAIMILANDRILAARLAKAARETIVADFSLNRMVDRTLRIMEMAVADKWSGGPSGGNV